MKKLLLISALLLSFTVLFAQNNDSKKLEVAVAASPFSFQNVSYNGSSYAAVNSKYGFGLKVGTKYFCTPNLFLGLDTTFDSFYLGESYKGLYSNLKLMPELGVKIAVNEKVYLFADAGAGLVLGNYDNTFKPYPGTKATLGTGYAISDKFSLEAMIEGGVHWQNHSDSDLSAVVYSAGAYAGVTIKF